VTQDRRARTRDYAMLMLASSYEATNQLDKGADIVRDALGTYPASEFTGQLKGRLGSIKRALAASAAIAPAGTAPATGAVPSPTPTSVVPASATAPVANPTPPR
jgi:hypothetical protein